MPTVVTDYKLSKPQNHPELVCYLYRKEYPKYGTINYYRFLELLKYLEKNNLFSIDTLTEFEQEVAR